MNEVVDKTASTTISVAAQSLATFLIGVFAGICSVFVPRLGGLLVIQDMEKVALFPSAFILLGMVYATIVGAVAAILYFGKAGTPGERFLTALGVPALLAGAISATAHTSQVQNLRAETTRLGQAVITAESIPKIDTPIELAPLGSAPAKPESSGLRLEQILGVGTAHAQGKPGSTESAGSKWSGWQIQAQEPEYAVLVYRAKNAQLAEKKAAELNAKALGVQAMRAGSEFAVITGVKPESAAILEAARVKRELGLQPELIRVK